MRKKKAAVRSIIILLLLTTIVLSFFITGNSVSYKIEKVGISSEGIKLQAQLLNPKLSGDLQGVVILVHGDGPVDALANGYYISLCEELSKNHFAVISWDKPGVNGSEGSWLDQSMNDRAEEVINVIEWAKKRNDLKQLPIGLWGGSQAGWVIPMIPEKTEIDFIILQSPAINWVKQGLYNTISLMDTDNEDIVEAVTKKYNDEVELIKKYSYEDYIDIMQSENSMSKERYNFVKKNIDADVTEQLKTIKIPVLLLLGEMDININPHETRKIYEKNISKELLNVVWIDNTNHLLLKEPLVDNDLLFFLHLIFKPKEILAPEYLESLNNFLEEI